MKSLQECRWRQGRHVERNIYAQHGDEPSTADTIIAVAVGSETIADIIAHAIVEDHNRELDRRNET